jgi:2-polyprenyl-6-methoxyphenol hydroxylase-like FAD-dependent oxidoreductase
VRVIVVGAGIAGLSAAIALRQKGNEVVVLERAPRIDPVGAGITLFANALRALDRLGVGQAVAARGAAATRSAILTWEGRELTRVPPDLLEGTIALHLADLQAELAAAAGEVRLGEEVAVVEQGEDAVVAVGADGGEERGDLLVGADGLSSVVRRGVADAPIRYAGYTAWRGVSSVPVEPGRLTESWGVGERFGLVDIGGGRTYWFATKNAPEGEPDEPGGRKTQEVEISGTDRVHVELNLRCARRPDKFLSTPRPPLGAATRPVYGGPDDPNRADCRTASPARPRPPAASRSRRI